jgi:ABC-type branched-subunit amino acid transport system ATPase component/ABC-type branched-subunit amino acid transport system permease subunit
MIEIFGLELRQQMLVTGLATGLLYALLAGGLVLLARATGVINFAHAQVGAFCAVLLALMNARYGIPFALALPLAVLAGVLANVGVELTVVRRLFKAPRLVLFIATLGVAQLFQLFTIQLPDVVAPGPYPSLIPGTWRWEVTDDMVIRGRELSVFIVVPALMIALAWLLGRTRFGLVVRATTANADTARLYGMSPKTVSTAMWALAGGLAAVTAILAAPVQGVNAAATAGAEVLGPSLLLKALAIGVVARMRSLPWCLAAGVVVGLVEAVVQRNVSNTAMRAGVLNLMLFGVVLIAGLLMERRSRDPDDGAWTLAAKTTPVPPHLIGLRWIRYLPGGGVTFLLVAGAVLAAWVERPSKQVLMTRVVIVALIVLSVMVITGWAGLLSLGQFAIAGVGGMTTAALYLGHPLPVIGTTPEVPWAVALLGGTVVGTVVAVVVSLPALRVRGLVLAVGTLAFAIAASSWFFKQDYFLQGRESLGALPRPELLGVDFSSRRSFFYLCLGVLAVAVIVVSHLRSTGIGRSILAVRENEQMAASSTVSPTRTRLIAFTVSGVLASLAGGLYVTMLSNIRPEESFAPDLSIDVVAMAVIGGMGTVSGALLGPIWVLGLPAAFGNNDTIRLMTSSIGLLILLMYFPGGLAHLGYRLRDLAVVVADRRHRDRPGAGHEATPSPVRAVERSSLGAEPAGDGAETRPLVVRDLSVAFGGLRAVDSVSIHVDRGEVVGLIGTNGAGKSTLMNAISGFVWASAGTIDVSGTSFEGLAPFRRHGVHLGRSFQAARLYPELTVRDAVLVAMEARKRTPFVASLLAAPPSLRIERHRRSEVDEIIDFLGLGRYAQHDVSDLSTGTRRIVEFACLLAIGPRLVMMDEPTGGVAQRETEAFGPLILRIRQELDASILIIEHDMPLVMSISDRLYCLEAGSVIAEGTPDEVRNDPAVVASYLGTDQRAIERSGPLS